MADRNFAKNVPATTAPAFGFIASKDVVAEPWYQKTDVELLDFSGEILEIEKGGRRRRRFFFDPSTPAPTVKSVVGAGEGRVEWR